MARKKSSEKICITFFKKIQSNAIKRGLSFDLDIDYLWDLFLKQNKKCALTKVDINIVNATISYNYHLNTASLDRIDSSKGYEKDNIRWVHKAINHIKSDIDDNDIDGDGWDNYAERVCLGEASFPHMDVNQTPSDYDGDGLCDMTSTSQTDLATLADSNCLAYDQRIP